MANSDDEDVVFDWAEDELQDQEMQQEDSSPPLNHLPLASSSHQTTPPVMTSAAKKLKESHSVIAMDSEQSDTFQDDDQDFELDDDFYHSDGADVFHPVISVNQVKKPYQVDFKLYSSHDITNIYNKDAEHVAGILGCTPSIACLLLQNNKWNKELLVERFMEDPETILSKSGVPLISNPALLFSRVRNTAERMCDICCNNDPELEFLSLSCQHAYCFTCYNHFLELKITEGEFKIKCPSHGCPRMMDDYTLSQILSPAMYAKYAKLILTQYVLDHSKLKFCPFPGCEQVVDCPITATKLAQIVPTVECASGHRFCHGCGLSDHQPAPCHLVKLWLKKCADDSETANWMNANTKECPTCQSTIEKNGGCNHMTCKKCKHEFCWICMGPWSQHGTSYYNCNRFNEDESVKARDQVTQSRVSLERYLHYYNRYANHEQSAKLDKELYLKTEKKMEQIQVGSELSWIEVQFLKKAVDVLLHARSTLKWTYCFAYYLSRASNATAIFEDNQRDLEMAVEALSEMLEQPISPERINELKQQVLDKSVYVSSRREVLLCDTALGLREETRWSYNADAGNASAGSVNSTTTTFAGGGGGSSKSSRPTSRSRQ